MKNKFTAMSAIKRIVSSKIIIAALSFSGGAVANDIRVVGDSPCPSGHSIISSDEARESKSELCGLLGTWDIVRLSDGGSMDGPGYGCKIRDFDSRGLGHTLCKAPVTFKANKGDNSCSESLKSVSPLVARGHKNAACKVLGRWFITRLAGGGSMDGPGYGCKIRDTDKRGLGHSLCATYDFKRVTGDTSCPSGYALTTPQEARSRKTQICSTLGQWDIVRLAGGGSIDGPGYGCGIRDLDSRALGHSMCTEIK